MSEIAAAQRAVDVDPATTVLDLLAKVASGDIDGAVALTTDDVSYQNVPMGPPAVLLRSVVSSACSSGRARQSRSRPTTSR